MLFAAVFAQAEEHLAPLIMDPLAFAGIAVATFVIAGFVTFSFRDVASRHRQKWDKSGSHDAAH